MKQIKINFENCYGIKKLEYSFNFDEINEKQTCIVYAPNGTMKTSFANTFDDFSKNIETVDRVFQENKTIREIHDENDAEIDKDAIFVIKSYNENYESEKVSLLVANKKIKDEYEKAIKELNESEENLFKEIKKNTKLDKKFFLEELKSVSSKEDNYTALLSLLQEVNNNIEEKYAEIDYKILFNKYTEDLFKDDEFKKNIKLYSECYNNIINSSVFLDKTFDYNSANVIADNLDKNGFFKDTNTISRNIYINSQNKEIHIKDKKDLIKKIEDEKNKILDNDKLKNIFNRINNYFDKENNKKFLKYISDKPDIISYLKTPNILKNKILVDFLKKSKSAYNNFVSLYEQFIEKDKTIREEIKNSQTEWEQVIKIFNSRFFVPFKVEIANIYETITQNIKPKFKFIFDNKKEIEKDSLLNILSKGEQKALYLLNIIYEIQVRKKANTKSILIIDDIADSFDYKNKYAIVEYLFELSNDNNFYQIILTHNFDFFRLVSSRLNGTSSQQTRRQNIEVIKDDNSNVISLQEMKYQNNPFSDWKKHLSDNNKKLIASICFIRNLAEYVGKDKDYEVLTSMLHIKENSQKTKKDLENSINNILEIKSALKLSDPDKLVKDFIYETISNEILKDILNKQEKVELEEKITLAIGIRLKTEEFILSKIKNKNISDIKSNQTLALINRYKKEFPLENDKIYILNEVNIITPEHIHLNSFMFEPILDLSISALYNLYKKVIDNLN